MSFSQSTSVLIDLSPTFSDYHSDFTTHISSARALLQSPTSTPSSLDSVDRSLQEATDVLSSLELEMQSSPPSVRPQLATHLTSARNDLHKLKTQLREARIAIAGAGERDREMLFSGIGGHRETQQRADTVDVVSTLEKGGNIIQNSRRLMAETEMIGVGILEDLHNQRQTIIRARDNVRGVGEGLEESSGVLGTMQRRAIVNRIMIWIVLAGIGVACLGVLYARIFHARDK